MSTSPRSNTTINIGYVPLLDSAPLIIAEQMGYFAANDVNIKLIRESNWARIRDKLFYGLLDAAHMPAPMVVASHLFPTNKTNANSFKAAVALGYNGNAISLSNRLLAKLNTQSEQLDEVLAALKNHLQIHQQPLKVGTVHSFSMHSFLLRLLFQRADIDASCYQLIVVPPVQMVEAIRLGEVDLVCVGEPWNTAAQLADVAKIICYGSELWSHAPEKVLGVNQSFAAQQPHQHQAIVQAIVQASRWLEEPNHMAQAALWLAQEQYLDCSSDLLVQAMINQWHLPSRPRKQRKVFFDQHANAPWMQHARWIEKTITHLHQIDLAHATRLEDIYDWSTYRNALQQLDIEPPRPEDFPGDIPE